MAAKKTTKSRKKPQYVKGKTRKGPEPPTLARRAVTIFLLLLILGGLLYGLCVGFQWIGCQLKSENPRFEIHHLIISCDGKLSEDYIRETSGLREGMNLWEFTFEEIEEKLLAVSRVEAVDIQRKLPNTLILKVKERVPVGRIAGRRTMRYPFMVDRFGVVLPHRHKLADLPLVKGLDIELQLGEPVEHADVELALKIISMCEQDSFLRTYISLDNIDVQYSDYMYLYLKSGTRAKISRHSLKQRLYKLASTIKIAASRGQRVKTADLTLESVKVPTVLY